MRQLMHQCDYWCFTSGNEYEHRIFSANNLVLSFSKRLLYNFMCEEKKKAILECFWYPIFNCFFKKKYLWPLVRHAILSLVSVYLFIHLIHYYVFMCEGVDLLSSFLLVTID